MKYVLLIVSTLVVAPALASHTTYRQDFDFEAQFNEDDDFVWYCTALNAIFVGADLYIHERRWGPVGTGVAGVGVLADYAQRHATDPTSDEATYPTGGGTWLYQEQNGIPGLQVGGTALAGGLDYRGEPSTGSLTDPAYGPHAASEIEEFYCYNSDRLITGSAAVWTPGQYLPAD